MNRRALHAAIMALAVWLCSCATNLTSTDVGYQRVSPERPRLSWTWTLLPGEAKNAPVLTTKLATEYLSERVETRHYRTSYSWANRGCWFGTTALMIGAAVKVKDWGLHYEQGDTVMGTSTLLAILSIFPFGAGLIYPDFPLPPRRWEKKATLEDDTSYRFPTPVSDKPVPLSASGNAGGRTLRTDKDGNLNVDVRDFFYESLPADSPLLLTATWSGLSASLTVPPDRIRAVRRTETEASALLARARAAETESKDGAALALYDSLDRAYASTRAASQASDKAGQLREKVKQARLAQARRELERVSQDKVQNAIDRLHLTEYESNAFGQSVEHLAQTHAASVMKDGCGFPLTDAECAAEYQRLTLFQKFYALLKYKESLGTEARPRLAAMLNMSMPIIGRLISLDSKAVLK